MGRCCVYVFSSLVVIKVQDVWWVGSGYNVHTIEPSVARVGRDRSLVMPTTGRKSTTPANIVCLAHLRTLGGVGGIATSTSVGILFI